MNRAAGGEGWLRDRAGAVSFLARIGEICAGFPVDLHAYCLLPRHYHLLVRAELDPLRSALADLEAVSGFPRAAPPRTVPVSFGRHVMGVSRYIHLNPVDAGLVWRPEHWPYSSFRGYLGDLTAPGFLQTEAVLGRFGTIGARHRHRAYVYAGLDPGTRDLDGRPRWSALFHPGSSAEDLAWRIEPVLSPRARRQAPATPALPLHRLAQAVSKAFAVPTEALRSARSGGPAAAVARGALIHAARAQGNRRLRDVAAFLGYASPAVTAAAAERFDRALRLDGGLASRLKDALASATSASW
jgi:REP-associated tyrosine transposase